MTGENMVLRYPQRDPWLRATVDAQLTLEGMAEAMTLAGDVTVRDATYSKEFTTAGNIFDFAQGGGVVPVSSTPSTPTLPLSYDVRIRAPSTVRARTNLLRDVMARADLRLVGTFERPALLGNIDVDTGDVFFEGKRYEIQRAGISFNNPTAIEPFYDIEAETRIRASGENYRVTINSTGLDPAKGLTFNSDPPLAEYQLLALLLGDIAPGRDVELRQYTGVTPQEQLMRDRLARALTGVVSSEISRTVEEAFSVESFQLTTSLLDPNAQAARLDPAARVVILKRIRPNVYLTYSRSLSSTTRDQLILLEIDQSDRLSWILSRNEDGTYALDLRFRRTY